MNDNLLTDFLAECREHLEGIEADLLTIEESGDSADKDLINKVFRAAHSIKGGSGFFQLDPIKLLAHSLETVLDMIRSGKMKPNPEIINVLLLGFDQLREMVNGIDRLDKFNIGSHVAALQDLVNQHQCNDEKGSMTRRIKLTSKDGALAVSILEVDFQAAKKENQYVYVLEYDLIHDIDHKGKSPIDLLKSLSSMGVIIDTIFEIQSIGTIDDEPVSVLPVKFIYRTVLEPDFMTDLEEIGCKKIYILSDIRNEGKETRKTEENHENTSVPTTTNNETSMNNTRNEVKIEEEKQNEVILPEDSIDSNSAKESKNEIDKSGTKNTTPVVPETLRINVESLDTLMAHAGELVLGRNQLIDAISRADKKGISASAQRLSYVISELQEAVMQTRLQPVGNVFNKFPRVVRDLCQTLKKEIRLQLEGKDVELDKTIIEGLSDPLTHMVRNAADHGIELPQERIKKGKVASGTVNLRAFHEAGHVVIEIEDDGKGIDPEKIADKALSLGIVSKDRIKGMTDYDKMSLIFYPGLSTADKITETSGRGVGMDVVKTNLDRLGGKVSIRSEIDKGTVFRIKLPLTLAIIPSLIISEEHERYAIPQVNVIELLRIPSVQIKERIQVVGDAEVVVLRGDLIPLVRFSDILGITGTYVDPLTGKIEIDRRKRIADRRSTKITLSGEIYEDNRPDDKIQRRSEGDRRYHADSDLNVVIIASGLLQYGLVVDELHNSEEIVVKPLGHHLKGLQEYAGATIMGDGEVALILDATGIAIKADITSVSAAGSKEKLSDDDNLNITEGTQSFLLFNNQVDEQCVLPLNLVQRVESITGDMVEMKGGKRTMKYRGSSLPLVQLSDVADVKPIPLNGDIAVIVTSVADHPIGLLGMMPVSVLETDTKIDTVTHRQNGISGSAIIGDKTILVVDIYEIVDQMHPEWSVGRTISNNGERGTVLLAEDSDFFRDQIERYITDAGYKVIATKDGQEAWEFLGSHPEMIHMVVTDIEMPKMNGIEFCKKIRSDSRFSSLPVIALTSLAGEEDEARGREAGITDYQIKLDRDRLLEALEKCTVLIQV